MLRSYLYEYSDLYIVLKRILTVIDTNNVNARNKKVIFKNNAPFRSCITKIDNTFIENAEDIDIVDV